MPIPRGRQTSPDMVNKSMRTVVIHGNLLALNWDRGALIGITRTSQLRRDGRLPSADRRRTLARIVTEPLHSDRRVLEEPMAERPQLLAMAAEIVSAHVRYNTVAVDQLQG